MVYTEMDLSDNELEISLVIPDCKLWGNFQKYYKESGDRTVWGSEVLEKEFNAKVNAGRTVGKIYINFPNPANKTWFLLRFSS